MGRCKNQLTPREREVAGLLAQGKPQREIARELVISRRTAYVHVRRVCEKVGARTALEAAVKLASEQSEQGKGSDQGCP